MTRLGKEEVLLYLNWFVRGKWVGSPYAGLYCNSDSSNHRVLWSEYWFTREIALWVKTNPERTLTIIRFSHERLSSRIGEEDGIIEP